MTERVAAFLQQHWGNDYCQIRFLIAVSGGIDSVVLCEIAHQLQLNWAIAHGNFQLRGEESQQDEAFVRQLAARYQVPFFVAHFDTQQYAEKQHISVQMAARHLRHAWFKELLQTHAFDYLMTAHQANDVLETALYNLIKGTGIAGLRSMQPIQEHIVRPLWQFERAEIIDFAQRHQLVWREDSSNASDKYSRNFIRHHVIPLLEQINPSVVRHFLSTSQRLADTEKIVQKAVQALEQQAVRRTTHEIWLHLPTLQQTEAPLLLLSEWLKKYHFSYAQSQAVWRMCLQSESGKSVCSATHQIVKDREHLILLPISTSHSAAAYVLDAETIYVKTPHFTLQQVTDKPYTKNSQTAVLNPEKLQFPLTLRLWQPGDSFCPLGMKGKKKKISNFLIDAKVPLPQKQKTYVLCQANGEIIWLVGHRVDERFAATAPHLPALVLQIVPHENILLQN